LINTSRSLAEIGIEELARTQLDERLIAVPATDLAREHLGRPLPNAALLGAFSAMTGMIALASVLAAIRQRFPGAVGEGNARSAVAADRFVRTHRVAFHA
jgi:pyruvate ferredoxin oxidoreductase gamma subunit